MRVRGEDHSFAHNGTIGTQSLSDKDVALAKFFDWRVRLEGIP